MAGSDGRSSAFAVVGTTLVFIVLPGIQHVHDCTITIETAVCPMADRGTQMGPMAVHVMGPYVGPMP